jgi:hypothetical protein
MRHLRTILAGLFAVLAASFYGAIAILDFIGRVTTAQDAKNYIDAGRVWIQKHPDFSTLVIPSVLLACAVGSLALTHIYPLLRKKFFEKSIEFVFPNECNLETKEGHPFKRSSTPVFSGKPIPSKRSQRQFFIGVHNPSGQKTLRNVRIFVECQTFGSVFSEYLICERTRSDSADISPQMIDYFMLGQGIDDGDTVICNPRIDPNAEYMNFFGQMESNKHIAFVIFGTQRHPALLKNNGLKLVAKAFADDTPPEECEFRLDLKDRIVLTRMH